MTKPLLRNLREFPMKPGETMVDRGFLYTLKSSKPHTMRDGTETAIVLWAGQCADCGVMFDFETGALVRTFDRYCPAHKGQRGIHVAKPFGVPKKDNTPIEGIESGEALIANLFRLRKALQTKGDDLGAAAVTLTRALYSAWLHDPEYLSAADDQEEAFINDSIQKMVDAAADFSGNYDTPAAGATSAEDLL